MNILVTGSMGYIGSNLCPMLLKNGFNVIQCDKKIGIFVEEYNLFTSNIDCIVHLAANSTIEQCIEFSENVTINNVYGTSLLFKQASDLDIPVIFASSQAVKEWEKSYYGLTKKMGEDIGLLLKNISSLRFANVYGGFNFLSNSSSVIAKFYRKYKENKPLIVHGTGYQTRDFIHVNDLCDFIIYLITNKIYEPIIEVGTGKEITIKEIAEQFGRDIIYKNDVDCGVMTSCAEMKLCGNNLNWDFKYNVFDYIEEIK